MKTPGGGGYGKYTNESVLTDVSSQRDAEFVERGSVFAYRQAQESV